MAGAYGVELYSGGTGLSGVFPDGNASSTYYKCNTISGNWNSCVGKFGYTKISYTSKSGGNGTPVSPYILNGCSFISCACEKAQYYTSSGCVACATGAAGATTSIHANTSCGYCLDGYFKYNGSCVACPSNAVTCTESGFTCPQGYYRSNVASCSACPSTGTSARAITAGPGATSVTECYVPKDSSFYDGTGSGTYDGDSYYCS